MPVLTKPKPAYIKPAPAPKTTLQWIAPDLVRQGIIGNEAWIEGAAERIATMFCRHRDRTIASHGTKLLRDAATTLALSGRWMVDYIEQAPILVVGALALAARSGRLSPFDGLGPEHRVQMIEKGREAASLGKLRDVLAYYGLGLPLRVLAARDFMDALSSGSRIYTIGEALRAVGELGNPSALAQSLARTPSNRRDIWINLIGGFVYICERRAQLSPDVVNWLLREIPPQGAADAEAELTNMARRAADHVADYYVANNATFNFAWSFERALEASVEWHEAVWKETVEDAHLRKFGIPFDREIDLASPWPKEAPIHAYQFIALRSGLTLAIEGATMHHCVGSYFGDVKSGGSVIYAIREDGKPVATVEYGVTKHRGAVDVALVQIKGPANGKVASKVRSAALVLMAQVRHDMLQRGLAT